MNVEWQQDEAGDLRIFRNSDPVVLGPDGGGEGMGDEDVRGGRGWCACCGPKAEVVTAAEVGSGTGPAGRKEGQRALPCCCSVYCSTLHYCTVELHRKVFRTFLPNAVCPTVVYDVVERFQEGP